MADQVNVPVKSAWASKINWAQAVAFAAMVLSAFGIEMDEQTRTHVLEGIISVQAIYTWITRTWFTTAVTSSSV